MMDDDFVVLCLVLCSWFHAVFVWFHACFGFHGAMQRVVFMVPPGCFHGSILTVVF